MSVGQPGLQESNDTAEPTTSIGSRPDDETKDAAAPGSSLNAVKKRKKKKKAAAKPPTTPNGDAAESAGWSEVETLPRGQTISIPWDLLSSSFSKHFDTFRTTGCASLELSTDRLRLRPCRPSDLGNLVKIKTEPTVQRTQLYGSPSASDCREFFLNRYIRTSMPRLSDGPEICREDFIFAITLQDPSSVELKPLGPVRTANRLTSTEGYLGNIGLSLETLNDSSPLMLRPRKVYTHPRFAQTTQVKLTGNMFYELHPQVWGLGLMSEAFDEVLRFAMEEVGCDVVIANPTTSNPASIKLCTKYGLKYSHTNTDNDERKPQAFYKISRKEWYKRYRSGEAVQGKWEGKAVCRWCMNFQLDEPIQRCSGCEWARYCSAECRKGDWVRRGGHQSECS